MESTAPSKEVVVACPPADDTATDAPLVAPAKASMPAMSIDQALRRYQMFVEFHRRLLKPDVDYGAVPGSTKRTLLKPGAEKLTTFFGLVPTFEVIGHVEDWTGEAHGGEPLFYYWYRCKLYRAGEGVAEADGSCNSREARYRWRWCDAPTPDDEAARRKQADRTGRFARRDGHWIWQERRPNRNLANLVNTVQKVAQKRALIAATLIGVNASEFFSQDLEDVAPPGVPHAGDSGGSFDEPAHNEPWGDARFDPDYDYEGELLKIQSVAHLNHWMAKHKPEIEAMPDGKRKEALKALCNEKHALLKFKARSGRAGDVTDEDKAALYGV